MLKRKLLCETTSTEDDRSREQYKGRIYTSSKKPYKQDSLLKAGPSSSGHKQ